VQGILRQNYNVIRKDNILEIIGEINKIKIATPNSVVGDGHGSNSHSERYLKLDFSKDNKISMIWTANSDNDQLANNVALRLENAHSNLNTLGNQEVSELKTRRVNREVALMLHKYLDHQIKSG